MFDVLIIGGGLAGSLVATLLQRLGLRIVIVDRQANAPAVFRAEQLVGDQAAALRRLDLLDDLVAGIVPRHHAVGTRGGRIVGGIDAVHYGFTYQMLVARMRQQLPPDVLFIIDRVVRLQTGRDRQVATLASGAEIEARLAVVATGQERLLLQQTGIERQVLREGHSLTIGFDVSPVTNEALPFAVLTCYPEKVRHRIDYLSLFPIGNTNRVNLFTYARPDADWVRILRSDPHQALTGTMPGLERILGPLEVTSRPQLRVNDLACATNVVRDGLVLIGDAYRTSCPSTGTGINRLLRDAEALTACVPQWLDGKGVTAERVAAFYDDPAKRTFEQTAADLAEYQRSAAITPGLRWSLHRRQLALRQRLGGWFGGPRRLTLGYTFARRSSADQDWSPPMLNANPEAEAPPPASPIPARNS